MSNTEDNVDEHEHDSSDNEKYESLLTNPSYLSSTMKVRNKMRSKFFREAFSNFLSIHSVFC